MRIIHTADWHIGKIVNQVHMIEDQAYILNEFIELVSAEKPDVVVIAGDVYDRSVPPVEAVELLDHVLTKILIDFKIPVIIISGNHDSGDRVGFASEILKKNGLYIYGKIKTPVIPVKINDEYGVVNFYPIPYCEPAEVRHLMQDDSIHSHNEAMGAITNSIRSSMSTNERNIIIAHGFVMGGMSSDSERPLSIGGSEYIDASVFNDFDYTALGHLHAPQKIGSDKIRYSGSLLKYSFSEARQRKSISIVDMDGDGNVKIEKKALPVKRNMRVLTGDLHDILNPDVYKNTDTEDYVCVNLTDEGEIVEPMSKIRAVYPNVMKLVREPLKNKYSENAQSIKKSYKNRNIFELFGEFYNYVTGNELTEDKKSIISDALEKIKDEAGDCIETG